MDEVKASRGDANGGDFVEYIAEISEGMVVLDAVHEIQATQATDLACRWNCKAGKCGSCSAEINDMPKLMCMTRLDELTLDKPVTIEPMRAFPRIRDLVMDVSWNYTRKKSSSRACPTRRTAPGAWRRRTLTVSRNFASACARTSVMYCATITSTRNSSARDFLFAAALEMHPLDTEDRLSELKQAGGIGYCNITKCCTKVCPENITITDNAIIPLKERVVDEFYDPLRSLLKLFRPKT